MMDLSKVSPKTYLLTEDNRTLEFYSYRNDNKKIPSPEECKGKLKGVCLSYAFCGEQDFGIDLMAHEFEATEENMIIHKIPESFETIESKKIKAIRYGRDFDLDSGIVERTKKYGIISCWDDANFIICASPEYHFVIDSIKEMFNPYHVRFGFSKAFAGRCNLLILTI